MKKLAFFSLFILWLVSGGAQTIQVTSSCFGGTFNFGIDQDRTPDPSGRNFYKQTDIPTTNVVIAFSSMANRWEIRADGAGNTVYYFNSFASSPNPPDGATAAWTATDVCGDAVTVTGTGTQTTIGGDPCADLGGDSDDDGACDDVDICDGHDDFEDSDSDGIPDGCDANPNTPDGVLVDADCLHDSPILFTLSGQSGGRNVYSTTFANGLEVRYNAALGRWEIRASSGSFDVYFYNTFASYPDPPATAGSWVGGSICNALAGTVSGSGTQNTLGCTISINNISVTQPPCGNDGAITVTTTGAKGTVTYKLTGPSSPSNTTGVFNNLPAGMYTISVSDGAFPATGASTCTASDTRTLTVQDATLPDITCPSNISVSNDEGLCSAVVSYTAPVGTDNCPGASTTRTAGLGSGATFPLGATTETYQVTDASDNVYQCSFTVTVTDDEAPAITCPGNQIVSNDPGECGAIVSFTAPVGADNCAGASTVQTSGLSSGATFPVGVSTVEYTVTDAAGHTDVCSFTITVQDTEEPVADCEDITVDLVGGVYELQASAIVGINASDNCEFSASIPTTTFDCGDVGGTIGVELTLTDPSGNQSSCTAQVTVADNNSTCNQPPNAVCQDITVAVDGSCQASIEPEDVDLGSSDPDSDPLTFSLDDDGPFSPGIHEVELTVSDGTSSDNCTATVTVIDDTPPSITCPANKSVSTDPGDCAAIVSYTAPVGADNCSGAITVRTDGPASGASFPLGSTTVEYTVTDASGNTDDCSFTVTVTDNEAATAVCTSATITLGADGSATLTPADIDAGSYDNCSAVTLNISTSSFDCYELGEHTVTLTASDNRGQSSTCTVLVTLEGLDADCDGVADLCDLCPGGDDKVDNDNDGSPDCIDFPGIKKLIAAWTCGKGKKVTVCHIPGGDYSKRSTLCVSVNELAMHLAHGDYIGDCDNAGCSDAGSYLAQQSYTQPLQQFRIFPNPASQKVRFDLGLLDGETGTKELSVYSSIGQRVQYIRLANDFSGTQELDVSQFKAGIYYVQVLVDGRSVGSGKLIVNR